ERGPGVFMRPSDPRTREACGVPPNCRPARGGLSLFPEVPGDRKSGGHSCTAGGLTRRAVFSQPGGNSEMIPSQWLDRHREELVGFGANLSATPSPNPPGDERAVLQVILAEMQKLGLTGVEIAAKEPHRPNMIYRLLGRQPGQVLMLCGHSDTKPVGDR